MGADVAVQTAQGLTASVFGRLHPDVSVDVEPTLSPEDALSVVAPGARHLTGDPELVVVLDHETDTYRLVYQIQTFDTRGLILTQVDARTGAVVSVRNILPTQDAILPCVDCAIGEGRGVKGDIKKLSTRMVGGAFRAEDVLRPTRVLTYDLDGDWAFALEVLGGAASLTESHLASDADNVWHDGASVDAHAGAGWTVDYLYHRFGRKGLDGNDGPITLMVHPVRRVDFLDVPDQVVTLFHLNAFFCRACGPHGIVVFGEGLPPTVTLGGTGQLVDFFAAGVDIVAHELGHALTGRTSQLVYQNESGALSEAFSDLIGVGTEFFMAETGRHLSEDADYLLGEDVIRPGGIRSLQNPLSRGDPDHYSLRFLGESDNGGVHTNSTIVTHAYYLAVEGGTNATSGVTVIGLGPERRALVEQIFYRALAHLVPADATFSMARAATLQSARDLSNDDGVLQAVAAAWSAVGVE